MARRILKQTVIVTASLVALFAGWATMSGAVHGSGFWLQLLAEPRGITVQTCSYPSALDLNDLRFDDDSFKVNFSGRVAVPPVSTYRTTDMAWQTPSFLARILGVCRIAAIGHRYVASQSELSWVRLATYSFFLAFFIASAWDVIGRIAGGKVIALTMSLIVIFVVIWKSALPLLTFQLLGHQVAIWNVGSWLDVVGLKASGRLTLLTINADSFRYVRAVNGGIAATEIDSSGALLDCFQPESRYLWTVMGYPMFPLPGGWGRAVHVFHLLGLASIVAASLGVKRMLRRRFGPNHCTSCRYDLRGSLDSARCPECGAGISDDQKRRIRDLNSA